jgi:tetratricopeptide (TPR) repeat protein
MMDLKKIFLIMVLAMTTVAVNAQSTLTDAINAYNQARELATAKDFDTAISMYEEAITIADELGQEGQDIKQRSEKAIPQMYFQRAVVAYNTFKGDPSIPNLDEAIEEFGEAEEMGQESGDTQVQSKSRGVLAQLYYQKATMLFKREEFEAADEALNQAIQTNSNYAKAYYQKGLVYKKTNPNDVEGIMSFYDRAIAVGEQVNDNGTVRQARESAHGELLFRGGKAIEAGNSTQAIEFLELSLEYDSGSADSYYRLAEASNKLGRRDAAIQHAQKALDLEPGGNTDKAKIYFELGVAYQAKGNKGEACKALSSASYGSFKSSAEHKMEFELKCESASPQD